MQPFSHPLTTGDRLTVFSNHPNGAAGCIGVGFHGRCYALHASEPVDIGTEIILADNSANLETPWSTGDPKLQVDVRPLLTYRYGWIAHSEAESYLWSRDGEPRRASYSCREDSTDYRIADLKLGVYVRFIFTTLGVTPIVVYMTHAGPKENVGAQVDLGAEQTEN